MKYTAITVALITGLNGIAGASRAGEPTHEQMSCRSVRGIFDAPQPDMIQVREIFRSIERVFTELDVKNAAQGRPAIYARMSVEGKQTTSAVVTARCDDYPNDNLKQSATAVYETFQAMGDAIGVNE